jgi:hypothetical protein
MIAVPMPGACPPGHRGDRQQPACQHPRRERGPRRHGMRLIAAEWTVVPYERVVRMSRPLIGPLNQRHVRYQRARGRDAENAVGGAGAGIRIEAHQACTASVWDTSKGC